MEIIARHYETLRASYDGSRSLRRGTKVYDNDVYRWKRRNLEKDNRGKQIYSFFPHNIKFGPSFKCKHSQVRVKYW
jgi:hypothetical protein